MALVFVVDPRSKIFQAISAALAPRGHKLRGFSRLGEALAAAKAQEPAALILDIDERRSDAAEAVARSRSGCPDALIFPVFGRGAPAAVLAASLDSGACDFFLEPIAPAEVAARVGRRLRSESRAPRRAPRRPADHLRPTRAFPPPQAGLRQAGPAPASLHRPLSSNELSAKRILAHALAGEDERLQGRVFDRYRLARVLGVGGMGVVLEAIHRETGRRLALKVLRPDLHADTQATMRFLREAYVLQGIRDRNVVRLEDIGLVGETHYYTMEFVEGETLGELLDRRQLEPFEACTIAYGVAKALAALARSGVVHRDIKPANIFLSSDLSDVKLGDFGLAKRSQARDVTPRRSLIGTPHYLAPEVINGEPATPRSDIYSLGVVLHEALCGEPLHADEPTAALMFRIVYGEQPNIEESLRAVPVAVREAVARATARYPEDRYRDAASFAKDLDRLRIGLGRAPNPRGILPRG